MSCRPCNATLTLALHAVGNSNGDNWPIFRTGPQPTPAQTGKIRGRLWKEIPEGGHSHWRSELSRHLTDTAIAVARAPMLFPTAAAAKAAARQSAVRNVFVRRPLQ